MGGGHGNAKKPGAYEPGGFLRPMYPKGNDVSFNDNLKQHIIPSRHDELNASWETQHNAYDNYYGRRSQGSPGQFRHESFQGIELNVPSMAERIRKAAKTCSIATTRSPVLHWSVTSAWCG
jgi:hypothetical protein